MDRINQTIQELQNAGLVLEVTAASQIQNLIAQLQIALSGVLDTAASALSAQQQQLVSGLSGLVNNIKTTVVSDTLTKVQQIANTFPWANDIPQVTTALGTVVAPNIGGDVVVTLNGNFIHIGETGYDATLTFGVTSVGTTTKQTQTISFNVPRAAFQIPNTSPAYPMFSVTIPYPKKELGGIFHKKEILTFKLTFIVLPPNPGTVTLRTTKLVVGPPEVQKNAICSDLVWDSTSDDDGSIKGCNMTDAWECDRESVWHNYTRREGTFTDLGNASTSTYVGWHFKTEHKTIGDSGRVTVDLYYTRTRPTPPAPQTTADPPVTLTWGERRVLPPIDATATWVLTYQQFNGISKDYSQSSSNDPKSPDYNPYLTVESAGNVVTVVVIPQA